MLFPLPLLPLNLSLPSPSSFTTPFPLPSTHLYHSPFDPLHFYSSPHFNPYPFPCIPFALPPPPLLPFPEGVTKRCRLPCLTNSALVYNEPKWTQPMSTCSCAHGAQIKFGDLTPHLTCIIFPLATTSLSLCRLPPFLQLPPPFCPHCPSLEIPLLISQEGFLLYPFPSVKQYFEL